jgi:regulator of sigma E protease
MNILIFLLILLVLVVVHEFGHFITAKKSGIRVDEFAFGFPPKIFSVKKGETKYSFNALPFGGFVKIFGESPDAESLAGPDSARAMVNKPAWVQALVLFAGIFFNLLLAWLLFSISFMSGMPSALDSGYANKYIANPSLTVTSIMKNSPAEKAGLKIGDRIESASVNNGTVPADVLTAPSAEAFQTFTASHGDVPVTLEIARGADHESLTVTPLKNVISDEAEKAAIGISMDVIGTLHLPVPLAVWQGLKTTGHLFSSTIVSLYHLLSDAILGRGSLSQITGPVGIVGVVGDAAHFGFIYLLSFTALISVNLAVINLIPFPALDGGRLLFLLIEKIKGSRIRPQVANMANTIGFALLIILMLVVTYHDIAKLVHS